MGGWKETVKKSTPFPLRVELLRIRRALFDLEERNRLSRTKGEPDDFPFVLSKASSALKRKEGEILPRLQKGKEINVAISTQCIDQVVIEPGEIFSYHRLVGRPTWFRGFRPGLELRNGRESAGLGGGCCLVSNLIYWLAINAGMIIIERHRHGLDLFPDFNRMRPFGCGATVYYNYVDLRFENPLSIPVLLSIKVEGQELIGKIKSKKDPGHRVDIEERGHRFLKENGHRLRENFIFRYIRDREGNILREELLAHNLCRVMY